VSRSSASPCSRHRVPGTALRTPAGDGSKDEPTTTDRTSAMTQENLEPTPVASDQPSPAAQFQFRFERFSAFVEEYTSTISLEGMFLKTREPRPVSTVVAFDIRLADGFQLIHGQGEVVWMRPDGLGEDQPAGMGIRFQALSDKGRELILKILDEHLKVGGQPFEVSEVPPGAVSLPGQGGAGAALGGLDFDAPWGAKLPDVPSEFLDEAGVDSGADLVDEAPTPEASAEPSSTSDQRAPSPPMDDVFALPADDAQAASQDDVLAAPADDAFAIPAGEEAFGGSGDAAFELEAVPEIDAEMGEEGAAEGALEFDDQQSLPGLEPLPGAGVAVSSESTEAADWDIQPVADFDEEPTLLGAGHDESALMGDDEPTLMSLNSAATAPPPPTVESPPAEDLPTFGDEEGAAAPSDFSEVVSESSFAAETFPETARKGTDSAASTSESTPTAQEDFPATEPVLEELGDPGAGPWNAPEPTPTFAMDAAPADPFATDTLEAGADPPDSLGADPFATDSIAAADSFAAPDSFAPSADSEAAEAASGGSWDLPEDPGDAFAAVPGTDFPAADGGASNEFQPVESSTQEPDTSASGVVEGGLVGPFQFEDYNLAEESSEGGGRSVFKRLRKPLLGLAVAALLIAVATVARGPVLEFLGGGESAEPIASRTAVPPGVPEENLAAEESLDAPDGEGEGEVAGVEEERDPESEESEPAPESTSPVPLPPLAEEPVAEETTSPLAEPSMNRVETLPPLSPPPSQQGRSQGGSQSPAMSARAEKVLDISTQKERGGTLAVIILDGAVGPGSAVVDEMAWDPDSEKLVLRGIREPYHPQDLLVNSAELLKVRTGHHPGSELWVVFDFTSTRFHLEPLQVRDNRIEVLIRQP